MTLDVGPVVRHTKTMTNTNETGIAWGSAAHFDRELADLMSDGCAHVITGAKLRAAARRAARAGSVRLTASDYGTIVKPVVR